MTTEKPNLEEQDSELRRLDYQLDFIKIEVESIQDTIWRLIEITQTTKNWAVVVWTGSIGLLLGQQATLSRYVIFTAVFPIIFWYVDAHWRHLQRRASYRQMKILEFLNDDRLLRSFKEKRVVDFLVYDPTGRQYTGVPDADKFSSRRRTFKYPEVLWFYFPMTLISFLLGIVLIFIPVA